MKSWTVSINSREFSIAARSKEEAEAKIRILRKKMENSCPLDVQVVEKTSKKANQSTDRRVYIARYLPAGKSSLENTQAKLGQLVRWNLIKKGSPFVEISCAKTGTFLGVIRKDDLVGKNIKGNSPIVETRMRSLGYIKKGETPKKQNSELAAEIAAKAALIKEREAKRRQIEQAERCRIEYEKQQQKQILREQEANLERELARFQEKIK